ncbi:MAG: carbohydrate ABC transporter permease [Limnochordaceae bacterium]|uniref:Carbohydrate ABC transporter permease n=1 Tax=Carboxydichorda subterranea TaxID=3109565 RepID=A0ABZ1C155_9FIRM|nr:carbohydrate ABC transporter permease [Limnochorda sp. L945t]MBE3597608.1 carbohydrate ABC transporter permease [Limnochordaceae bacterium]WRP18679.1 carbohydrate ABC transporter permease [Limnochorda sp. L945t]
MRTPRYLVALAYLGVTAAAIVIAFPFVWLVLTALKPYSEIYAYPLLYVPRQVTFEHFQYVLGLNFPRYFANSVIIGSGTALATVAVAMLPAYATTRFRFPGRHGLLLSILISQMFPQIVFVVPLLLTLRRLDLMNTYLGVIVSYLPFTTPIAVWLTRNFFAEVPQEIEEAAAIDGYSRMQAFFKVVLPLTLPGIASVGIYAFLWSWSELMFALSFLTSSDMQTVPVFLTLFVGQYQTRWGPLFAGSVLASVPPIIVFGLLQRQFIRGLTTGSVKG